MGQQSWCLYPGCRKCLWEQGTMGVKFSTMCAKFSFLGVKFSTMDVKLSTVCIKLSFLGIKFSTMGVKFSTMGVTCSFLGDKCSLIQSTEHCLALHSRTSIDHNFVDIDRILTKLVPIENPWKGLPFGTNFVKIRPMSIKLWPFKVWECNAWSLDNAPWIVLIARF